jgi:hypothetical protein
MQSFQINLGVKEILNIVNSDKVSNLDRSTIQYYKIKIINEINRLNNILPSVPPKVQEEISNKLISQLEGSIDKLNSLKCEESSLKTLVRRLDSICK